MNISIEDQTFWLGDWRVEPQLNRIVRGEEIVRIDPRNMKVLQLLASQPGHVFSQAEIEQAVWEDVIVTPNSVYQSIAQLRRALGDERSNPKYVETIARKGYRLLSPVLELNTEFTESDVTPHAAPSRPLGSTLGTRRRPVIAAGAAVVIAAVLVARGYRDESMTVHHSDEPNAFSSSRQVGKETLGARELYNYSVVALEHGKHMDALEYLRRARDIERERVGSKHPSLGVILAALANAYIWVYDYDAAEASARSALDAFEGAPERHPDRIKVVKLLGHTLLESGNYTESDVYLTEALRLVEVVFGETSSEAGEVLANLAILRLSQGELTEAEDFAKRSIAVLNQVTRDELLLCRATSALVAVLLEQHRYADAKKEIEHNLTMLQGVWSPDHPYFIATRDLYGKVLLGLREYPAAEDVLRRNIELWSKNEGWSKRVAGSASALGEALFEQGRVAEAEQYLRRASLEIDETAHGREERARYREHARRLDKLKNVGAGRDSSETEVAKYGSASDL